MHIQKHYIRFNIFIIRALTNDILLSSFAGFSLLRRICCTRIIVSFGIPDNDSVVWFINIGCLHQRVSRFDLPSIKFLIRKKHIHKTKLRPAKSAHNSVLQSNTHAGTCLMKRHIFVMYVKLTLLAKLAFSLITWLTSFHVRHIYH